MFCFGDLYEYFLFFSKWAEAKNKIPTDCLEVKVGIISKIAVSETTLSVLTLPQTK